MIKKLLFVVLFLGLMFAFYYVYDLKTKEPGDKSVKELLQEKVEEVKNEKQEIVLFEEMTVPFLRDRTYESNLGELKLYQEKANYNSYLTSYTSDGLKINGLLTIPKGEVPSDGFPAVVFVHGYIPPTLYKTTEKYIEYVDYLAKNGIVVFKVDLRGHGSSEGEPGGAYYSSDYVVDVLNAYDAISELDYVNKSGIGLWGHSMAGNVVFRAAAVKKDIPTVVIWAGAVYSYSDFVKYGLSDNSYRPPEMNEQRQRRRQLLFDTHGQFSESSSFWSKVAAVNYIDEVSTKFFIHHAVDDNVVNVGYSRDLVTILEAKKVPYDYQEYGSGGHNINGASFSVAMKRTVESLLGR